VELSRQWNVSGDIGRRELVRNHMKNPVCVYWLVPAKPYSELLREMICVLAEQFDAPRFEPHLTLLVAQEDRQAARKILRQVQSSPIRLKISDVSASSKFTKTLFIRFKSSRALNRLVVDLTHAIKRRVKVLRDPHLSLLYRKMPVAVKKELACTMQLPFREVLFDSIKAVRCASPTLNRADVEAWRVMATKFLADS
jgi:2'-5' RNA ligase